MLLRLGSPLWRPVPIPVKHGGCRSSEDLFSISVLQKGGTVAYTIQYINKTAHTSINRITVRVLLYDTILHAAYYNFPYTSPKFLGGRRDTKKLQHAAMRNKNGRNWHGTYMVRNLTRSTYIIYQGRAGIWHGTYTIWPEFGTAHTQYGRNLARHIK
jgi:hypothetical protein